jgi:TolA-binding protein
MFVVLGLMIFSLTVHGQGFKITQPSAIGGSFVATHLDGLVKATSAGPGLEVFIRYDLSPSFFISAGTGIRAIYDDLLKYENIRITLFPTIDLKIGFNLLKQSTFTPFLFAGIQALGRRDWDSVNLSSKETYYDAGIFGGGGFQIAFSEQLAFHACGDYRYMVTSTEDSWKSHWVAQAGLTYSFKQKQSVKKEEIEYPVGEGELSLDDLFRDDNASSDVQNTNKSNAKTDANEEDALALLFQPENENAAVNTRENTSKYADSNESTYSNPEVRSLLTRIDNLKTEMEDRDRQIVELQNQMRANEKAIAEVTRGVAGEYTGYSDGTFGIASTDDFKKKYEVGLKAFYDKKYYEAIGIFRGLMNSKPDHRLSSNCQYWIGEAYNAMKDYRNAIDAFNAVLRFRSSYKLDDALIMNGLCYIKLGDKSNARENFQELLSRFPDSEYAPKAMRYLGSL